MAYIDKTLAIAMINRYKKEHKDLPIICLKALDIAIDAVELTPPADVVEVKHGEWITGENGVVVCSECGEAIKGFVERLKKKSQKYPYYRYGLISAVPVRDIDNLVKEMVGNENG